MPESYGRREIGPRRRQTMREAARSTCCWREITARASPVFFAGCPRSNCSEGICPRPKPWHGRVLTCCAKPRAPIARWRSPSASSPRSSAKLGVSRRPTSTSDKRWSWTTRRRVPANEIAGPSSAQPPLRPKSSNSKEEIRHASSIIVVSLVSRRAARRPAASAVTLSTGRGESRDFGLDLLGARAQCSRSRSELVHGGFSATPKDIGTGEMPSSPSGEGSGLETGDRRDAPDRRRRYRRPSLSSNPEAGRQAALQYRLRHLALFADPRPAGDAAHLESRPAAGCQ